jgi:hypothetical protein
MSFWTSRQDADALHPHPAGDKVTVELTPYDLSGTHRLPAK